MHAAIEAADERLADMNVHRRYTTMPATHAQSYTVQARPTYHVIEGEGENDYTVALKQIVRYHPLPGHQGVRILRVWGPCGRIEAERIAVKLTDHVRERDAERQRLLERDAARGQR